MNTPEISQHMRDMIEGFEISSRADYERTGGVLSWPGVDSGITGGIGYDFGQQSARQIAEDWADVLPLPQVHRLTAAAGITGSQAAVALAQMTPYITIPYDAALYVFEHRQLPRYIKLALYTFPADEYLDADQIGVLTSLVMNRGPNCSADDPRRLEMWQIKQAILAGDLDDVPAFLRRMKRIWRDANGYTLPGCQGLMIRRDAEAAAWTESLINRPTFVASAPVPVTLSTAATAAQVDAVDAQIAARLNAVRAGGTA